MPIEDLVIEADSLTDFQSQLSAVGNAEFADCETQRIELFGPTVAGVCILPLGSLFLLPGIGSALAGAFTPEGFVVTNFGSLGGIFGCDAFIEFQTPTTGGQVPVPCPLPTLAAPGPPLLVIVAVLLAVIALITVIPGVEDFIIERLRALFRILITAAPAIGIPFLVAALLFFLAASLIGAGKREVKR